MGVCASLRIAIVGAASIALAACTAPQEPVRTDQTTFVSLNPCLDAILVEIARPEQVLALSHYSRDPNSSSIPQEIAARYSITGGTAEEVIALAPDIVLASSFIDPATHSALERAGLRVETFGSTNSVEESVSQVERLATIAGNSDKGAEMMRDMMARPWPPVVPTVSGEEPWQASPDPTALLWQAGEITPGAQTLIAELLRESGFASYAEASGLEQADRVSLEQILSDPPDLLLIAGDSAGQRHPALRGLADTRVETFEPSLFYCGGPSIGPARARLAQIRYSFEDAAP